MSGNEPQPSKESSPVLKIEKLNIHFRSKEQPDQVFHAVKDLNLKVNPQECVAIVGESGSGKSISALSITRLLPEPPASLSGKILWNERNLLDSSPQALRRIRGKEIAYIFQDPMNSLNPVRSIGSQMREMISLHRPDITSKKEADREAVKWLEHVGIPQAADRLKSWPFEFSGGMLQRVMIAMALCAKPKLLIADEPTTALDVTLQQQIMELLNKLKHELGMSIILITHNFGILPQIADRVAVMFRGELVEEGTLKEVLQSPQHPYTKALIACVPQLHRKQDKLPVIDDYLVSHLD